jgi:hypothetical protein
LPYDGKQRRLLPCSSSKAAYQISDVHGFFIRAFDKGRSSIFVETINKGKTTSALATLEGGAPFCVPIFFATKKDQPLSASAPKHEPIRARDEALRI